MDIDYELASQYTDHPARFLLWLSASGNRPDDLSELESLAEVEHENFLGEYSNPADYAEETITNTFQEELGDLPAWLVGHLDWQAIWDRELRHDHYHLTKPDGYTLIWFSI